MKRPITVDFVPCPLLKNHNIDRGHYILIFSHNKKYKESRVRIVVCAWLEVNIFVAIIVVLLWLFVHI